MNYEELLESRNGATMKKEQMPFGFFYKKLVEKKYCNVVDLRYDLADSLVFCDSLIAESRQVQSLPSGRQIHFTVSSDSAGIYGITLEAGNYQTFAQLLKDTPAVVAGKNFVENTIGELLSFASELHEQEIYHVCYSPQNIFARRGDHKPLLLFHGSFYEAMRDKHQLYEGSEDFVAPEVLNGEPADARSDVYSIGKFMEFLLRDSSVPVEYRALLKKATDEDPDKRYQTAEAMKGAMKRRRSTMRSLVLGGVALVVTLLVMGISFSLIPEPEDIEYVAPAPKDTSDDFLDDGFDPETELGLGLDLDSAARADHVDEAKMREYQAKAEQIFRKQYAKEADRILSKIYNKENLSATEKQYLSTSTEVNQELVQLQAELGAKANLTGAKSQRIASEIIDQITKRKKAEMAKAAKEAEGE